MKKIIALLVILCSLLGFSQNSEKQDHNLLYSLTGLDVKPEFPEGLEKLNALIIENMMKDGFEVSALSKIYATFVIEKDGSISDIKVLGRIKARKSEALIKIINSLPKWNPGKQNGTIVRVHYPLAVVGS